MAKQAAGKLDCALFTYGLKAVPFKSLSFPQPLKSRLHPDQSFSPASKAVLTLDYLRPNARCVEESRTGQNLIFR
jgi:hypothetical protein